MTAIINPGSHISTTGEGWTNTYETAKATAEAWLANMHSDGMTDVELLADATENRKRWTFTFRHTVTGTEVTLETHGINDIHAYCKAHVFIPKTYWNGSSVSEPSLEDFAADGFEPVKTYRPTP